MKSFAQKYIIFISENLCTNVWDAVFAGRLPVHGEAKWRRWPGNVQGYPSPAVHTLVTRGLNPGPSGFQLIPLHTQVVGEISITGTVSPWFNFKMGSLLLAGTSLLRNLRSRIDYHKGVFTGSAGHWTSWGQHSRKCEEKRISSKENPLHTLKRRNVKPLHPHCSH